MNLCKGCENDFSLPKGFGLKNELGITVLQPGVFLIFTIVSFKYNVSLAKTLFLSDFATLHSSLSIAMYQQNLYVTLFTYDIRLRENASSIISLKQLRFNCSQYNNLLCYLPFEYAKGSVFLLLVTDRTFFKTASKMTSFFY